MISGLLHECMNGTCAAALFYFSGFSAEDDAADPVDVLKRKICV